MPGKAKQQINPKVSAHTMSNNLKIIYIKYPGNDSMVGFPLRNAAFTSAP